MPPAARGSFKKPPLDPVKLFIKVLFQTFYLLSVPSRYFTAKILTDPSKGHLYLYTARRSFTTTSPDLTTVCTGLMPK
jgi:hypothetical protein